MTDEKTFVVSVEKPGDLPGMHSDFIVKALRCEEELLYLLDGSSLRDAKNLAHFLAQEVLSP